MGQPLDPTYLRGLIQQVLTPMGLYSDDACELLMFTAANESHCGEYLTQEDGGPARGLFQVEGATFNDLFVNFLNYHPTLLQEVTALSTNPPPVVDELVTNNNLAIAICRCDYYRFPDPIPDKNDIIGIWNLYKKRYNGPGKANEVDAIACYKAYAI